MKLESKINLDSQENVGAKVYHLTVSFTDADVLNEIPYRLLNNIVRELTDNFKEQFGETITTQINTKEVAALIQEKIAEKLAQKAVDNLVK